jgi:hypothetical protein
MSCPDDDGRRRSSASILYGLPNAGVKLHGGLGAGPMRSSVLGGGTTAAPAGREPCQLERLVRLPTPHEPPQGHGT